MPALRVIYCRRRTLPSLAIRLAAWGGPWSHCGVIVGDTVVESLASKGGVWANPLDDVIARSSAHEIVDIECPSPERGVSWALQTIGQPYDWGGVFAIPARQRQWEAGDRWYCSEHVERALIESGRFRFRARLHGISPSLSYYAR